MIFRFALAGLSCLAFAIAAALGQPAPTGQTTLRQADLRVGAVGYRIALAGRPMCGRTFPLTGLMFHHLGEYRPADRGLMIQRHGLDRGLGILAVLGGTPAARAGLVAGDVLLSVNGKPFASPAAVAADPKPKSRRRRIEESEAQLIDALRTGSARLRVLREGRELDAILDSVPGCFGAVRLARNREANSFATARNVVIYTGMLDFVQSDDELALVIGHELGHFILNHPPMHDEDKILASIGINSGVFWKREEAADRLALRLMAAGGYDLDTAIPFWRRFLGKYDTPQIFRYHPSLGARERITREEIAAIRGEPGVSRPGS